MITQFALRLVCGMSLMWALLPRRDVTTGFFRIQMLVTLGLSVLAALMRGEAAAAESPNPLLLGLCIAVAVASFAGSVVWTLGRRGAGDVFVFLVQGISAAALLVSYAPPDPVTALRRGLAVANEFSAAALLGGAVTGMLLGHWYLTAPAMSIAPLSRVNLFFGVAAVARLLVATAGLVVAWNSLETSTHWIWLALRWTAGLMGPLVVAMMVARILRYRNTQAATGVLFVGVILTFIGEMTAALLLHELGLPL